MTQKQKLKKILKYHLILTVIWFVFGFIVPLLTGLGFLKSWFMICSTIFFIFCSIVTFKKMMKIAGE
jgi:hypothetical protein